MSGKDHNKIQASVQDADHNQVNSPRRNLTRMSVPLLEETGTPTSLPSDQSAVSPNGRDDTSSGDYPTPYFRMKAQGLLRANGFTPLKRLSYRHMCIIQRHLEGRSGKDIASEFGCTQITVSRVLWDPLAQEIIQRALEDANQEINALVPLAVDAVRTALDHESLSTRLRGVDKLAKLKEMQGVKDNTRSAEDLIAEILKKAENVQVNQIVAENVQVNQK